jgi:ribonuclease HI
MFALAGSAGAVTHILAQNPHIKHLLFLSDNQAALSTITDTSAHPAQGASILFRRHIDNLLLTSNPFDVELIWIPGHKGILGNERADSIAKAAVNHHPIFASTISWAREKAKSRALKTWRTEWASRSHTNLAASALTSPPSTKLSPFHRFFNGTRATHSRIIQTLLGHFFCGEYYARFVPTESVSCPCGHPQQTRTHIITECPNFDAYRHHLRAASRTLSLPVILGTKTGLVALTKFIAESHAFSKDVPGGFADHG